MAESPVPPLQRERMEPLLDDLVVISNRQPYRHTTDADGTVTVDRPNGGLTAGLDPVMQRIQGTWIACGEDDVDFCVADADGCVEVPPDDPQYTLRRLHLTDAEIEGYYTGYANQMLWPLCHSITGKTVARPGDWEAYQDVNEKFAEAVVADAGSGSTIWFQDYHFALAPAIVRSRAAGHPFLMQFWHIPWPAPDVFDACPHARELVEGLVGNDLLLFHIEEYAINFLKCADLLLPGTAVDWEAKRLFHPDGTTTVAAEPLGIDVGGIQELGENADDDFIDRFRDDHRIDPDTTLAVGVDRLDYTKGIPNRLTALERLWDQHPHYRGGVTYVQKGSKSRSSIPAYREEQQLIADRVEEINDRFGTDDWTPIVLTTANLERDDLIGLYRDGDVAIVTPIRDGMNLVSLEYAAAQTQEDGVLVLSEHAGASEVLGDGAVTVNPHDIDEIADGIETALTMSDHEIERRCRTLRSAVESIEIDTWIERVFERARAIQSATVDASQAP